MKLLRKSNRVSWAPDVELCQVKHFSADDSPSKVGIKNSDNLFQNPVQTVDHLRTHKAYDFPPGFESVREFPSIKSDTLRISEIAWKCPPKIVLSDAWQVAAGHESKETLTQKQRELGVFEAIYPRLSAIPNCPFVSSEVEQEVWNDSRTLIVPVTPVEEDDVLEMAPREAVVSSRFSQSVPHHLAAASAALAAAVKNNDLSRLIDTDLLFKIFKDPETIKKLISSTPSTAATNLPVDVYKHNLIHPQSIHGPSTTSGMTSFSDSLPSSTSSKDTFPSHGALQLPLGSNLQATRSPLLQYNPTGNPSFPVPHKQDPDILYSTPSSVPPPALISLSSHHHPAPKSPTYILETTSQPPSLLNGISHGKTNPYKDVQYIKNLIRVHGEDNQEKHVEICKLSKNMQPSQIVSPRQAKRKFQKPCAYYMSATGCRNGSNCPFEHSMSVKWQTGKGKRISTPKRMKVGGEIVGN